MKTKINFLDIFLTILTIILWVLVDFQIQEKVGDFNIYQDTISYILLFILWFIKDIGISFDKEIKEYENLKNRVKEVEKKINNNLKK